MAEKDKLISELLSKAMQYIEEDRIAIYTALSRTMQEINNTKEKGDVRSLGDTLAKELAASSKNNALLLEAAMILSKDGSTLPGDEKLTEEERDKVFSVIQGAAKD